MLGWILTFLVIALIAAVLGFGAVAGAAAGIAKIIFYIFLVLLLVSLGMHFVRGTAPSQLVNNRSQVRQDEPTGAVSSVSLMGRRECVDSPPLGRSSKSLLSEGLDSALLWTSARTSGELPRQCRAGSRGLVRASA